MSNLFQIGQSGVNAANVNLANVSNNIDNATIPGYSRRSVVQTTATMVATAAGYIGTGTKVVTSRRVSSAYLNDQLAQAQSTQAQRQTYQTYAAQVDDMFGPKNESVSTSLSGFFDAVQSLANEPADSAVRQNLIGKGQSLATQFRATQGQLDDIGADVNDNLATMVAQFNGDLDQLADVDQKIVVARGTSGDEPSDLLDQRDQLIASLNKLVGVNVSGDGLETTVTTGNGQVLLSGGKVFGLKVVDSAQDPTEKVVAYTMPGPPDQDGKPTTSTIPFAADDLSGGSISGLLQFRSDMLDPASRQIGAIATTVAEKFNQVNRQGKTLDGKQGADMFSVTPGTVYRDPDHPDAGDVSIAVSDVEQLQASRYSIELVNDGTNSYYKVTRASDGAVLTNASTQGAGASGGTLKIDGLTFTLPDATANGANDGSAAVGASWSVDVTKDAAASLQFNISNTNDIAAAGSSGGSTNNANALAMANLQTTKLLNGGTATLEGAVSALVNDVGVKADAANSTAKAADNLVTQRTTAQQNVSGVNLQEEEINLLQYQEQYRAATRIVSVASNVFDTLLALD